MNKNIFTKTSTKRNHIDESLCGSKCRQFSSDIGVANEGHKDHLFLIEKKMSKTNDRYAMCIFCHKDFQLAPTNVQLFGWGILDCIISDDIVHIIDIKEIEHMKNIITLRKIMAAPSLRNYATEWQT